MPQNENNLSVPTSEQSVARGWLKIFIGFAAGVGKTYTMLAEANRRKTKQGQDIVIGLVETHGRKGTIAQIGDLEIIPRKVVHYKGSDFEEMDADAIIARKPAWVLIDELAHTNVPGSPIEKRYEDVMRILDCGISVLTTMNVQHLESLNDRVRQITGVAVRETVPDSILTTADEIVNIDITPRALMNRLSRGDVYQTDKAPQALANFFVEGNLAALREIALREVASEVDRNVQSFRNELHVEPDANLHERVMVCLSSAIPSESVLRRGWRIANRLQAEIVAVYVSAAMPTIDQMKILDKDFNLARSLNIAIEQVRSKDIARALSDYARENEITQIVIGHSNRSQTEQITQGSVINKLLELVKGIDVLIVATTKNIK